MLTLHTKRDRDDWVATRLDLISVLRCLYIAAREGENYIRFPCRLDGYRLDSNETSVVDLTLDMGLDRTLSVHHKLTIHGAVQNEYYKLQELGRFFNTPADFEVPAEHVLSKHALEWGTDYKPNSEQLEYREYARHGFVQGAQWAFKQMIDGNLPQQV